MRRRPDVPAREEPSSRLDDRQRDVMPDEVTELRPETDEEAWMADQLVRLVGGHLLATMDVEDLRHANYLEWAAEEARAQLTPAERVALAEEAREFAARMRAEFARLDAEEASRSAADAKPDVTEAAPAPHGTRVREREHRERVPRRRRRQAPMPVACVAGDPVDVSDAACVGTADIRQAVAAAAHAGAAPYLDLAVCAGVGRALWDEPCDRWLALPPGVTAGEHVALPVRGDSMQPLLHDGDTLLVRVGSACVPGDVVVARQPDDGYVVKRVGGRGGQGLRLVADNARYPDVLLPDDPSLVVGVVVLRWCPHGGSSS